VRVYEGDTFRITVNTNAPTTREYTVKMDAAFTPNVMRLSSWDFGSQWTVLRQPGYDYFDNVSGILTRTGGYPGGFTGSVRFGTATFIAGKPGKGVISLTNNSFIFNEASQNTYTGSNIVTVEVLPAIKKPPPPPPERTFDIALVLDKPVFVAGESIDFLLHLTNLSTKFEKLAVPVVYTVFNTYGEVVIEDHSEIDLNTVNKILAQKIDLPSAPSLPVGMYSIAAQVDDDNLTTPARTVGYFRIEGITEPVVELVTPKYPNNFLIYIIIALLIGLIVGGLAKSHKHELIVEEDALTTKTKKTKTKHKSS